MVGSTAAEEVVVFGSLGNLIGIITPAWAERTLAGVVLLNAGLIHRVGPGALSVRLARACAAAGHAALRFDFSGIGDSPARVDGLPVLEMAALEPAEGAALLARRGHERAILVGICSGALAALRAGAQDPSIGAVVLVNPPAFSRDPAVSAAAWQRRYTGRSLGSGRAWRNLLTGRVKYRRLLRAAAAMLTRARSSGSDPDLEEARSHIAAICGRGGRVLFLLSGKDIAVEHVGILLEADVRAPGLPFGAEAIVLEQADHLFLREIDKAAFETVLLNLAAEVASS